MFVSPRFHDIFGSGSIETRRADGPRASGSPGSQSEPEPDGFAVDAESIRLDITAAHRRAVRTSTSEPVDATDQSAGDP